MLCGGRLFVEGYFVEGFLWRKVFCGGRIFCGERFFCGGKYTVCSSAQQSFTENHDTTGFYLRFGKGCSFLKAMI